MTLLLIMTVVVSVTAMEPENRDPATNQILRFKDKTTRPVGVLTTSGGAPVSYSEATSTLNAPIINNEFFMDMITHLNRERIPERMLHARGTGAFGYFVVTHDITHICKADFLKNVGEKTPVAVRFSTATGERGASELSLEPRGFAIKFYTKEGNFDIVGVNTPINFFRDPIHFPTLVHATKRNPATNLHDPNAVWDVLTMIPETLHTALLLFADRGMPASYRNMPGYGVHTYQVVNKDGTPYFVKFHILPDGGIKNLDKMEARNISVLDPDYLTRDLFRAIGNGDFPSWTVSIQILTEGDLKEAGPRAFDITRTISLKEFPLHQVGKIFLNRNPKNFFAEIEQLAFCPGNLVPGILGAPDKVFEARRMAYRDAQFYRLGVNFKKIPVNCPFQVKTFTYNRDGVPPVGDNEEDIPNYYPNSFHGPVPYTEKSSSGLINIVEKRVVDNFDQIAEFYTNELSADERTRFIANLVTSLQLVTKFIQEKAIKIFEKIHPDLGNRVFQGLNVTASGH